MFKDLFKEVPGLGVGQGQGRLVFGGTHFPDTNKEGGKERESSSNRD